MNDDFLYRIRTEPPEHFAAGLKERLDSAPRRRARTLRFGLLAALLFGTAFAMVMPAVRHSISSLFTTTSMESAAQIERTAEAQSPTASPPEQVPQIADAPSSEPVPQRPAERQTERPPTRLALRPAPHAAEALPPTDVDTAQDESNISDWSAAALAARAREILDDDLFTAAVPAWPTATDTTEARTAIGARHALFRVIANSFEPVESITRKQRKLDRDAVALSAYRLLRLSTMIDDAYALDTRRFTELESVNSLVWNRSGVFRKEIQEFSGAARALLESAARGTEPDIWRDAARVNRSCLRCHEGFVTRRDLPPRK